MINEKHHALVADFGLSRLDSTFFNSLTSSLEHGCLRWQAPELLFPDENTIVPRPTPATDVWAFGMAIYVRNEMSLYSVSDDKSCRSSSLVADLLKGSKNIRFLWKSLEGKRLLFRHRWTMRRMRKGISSRISAAGAGAQSQPLAHGSRLSHKNC